jgi:hypothetical protein
MKRKIRAQIRLLVGIGVVASFLGIGLAVATTYPSSAGRPDNLTSSGCWVAGGSTIPQSLFDTWWVNVDGFTNVTTVFHDPCVDETDARFAIETHPLFPNVLGTTECVDFQPNGDCDTHNVRLDPDRDAEGYCFQFNTWCHEVGHSLGLDENPGPLTCMAPGQNACTDPGAHWYDGAHEVGHINSRQ